METNVAGNKKCVQDCKSLQWNQFPKTGEKAKNEQVKLSHQEPISLIATKLSIMIFQRLFVWF